MRPAARNGKATVAMLIEHDKQRPLIERFAERRFGPRNVDLSNATGQLALPWSARGREPRARPRVSYSPL